MNDDIVLIYIGRRQLRSGAVGHFFLDGDVERGFKKNLGARVIGGTYIIKGERKPDDGLSVVGSCLRDEADLDPRAAEWETADRAAYVAAELGRREKADREAGLRRFAGQPLSDLREQMRKLPPGQRVALTAQILDYLNH